MSAINHGGLAEYLTDAGFLVQNISKAACSNLDMVFRIRSYLDRNEEALPQTIVVFQTEWTRDFKYDCMQQDYGSDDWNDLDMPDVLASRWIERFYHRLSEISQEYDIPVLLIGGCSDTVRFDDMSRDYPGCIMACQSFTNLVLNGDAAISLPIFSWYTKISASLIKRLRQCLPDNGLHRLLTLMDLGYEREYLIRSNPQYFYPNGTHPNRQAHELLFGWLQSRYLASSDTV